MIAQLNQKKYNRFRKFSLYKDFLEVENNDTSAGISKTKIPLMEIGYNITYQREEGIWNTSRFRKIIVAVPAIMSTITFILMLYFWQEEQERITFMICFILFFLLSLFFFLIARTDDIILDGFGARIVFFRDTPNEQEVNEFIQQILDTAKQYQRNKFLPLKDYQSEEEKIQILDWLRYHKFISNSEYDLLREEIKTQQLF